MVPRSGAGIYTVWDNDGELIYVGIAGRNPKELALQAGCAATPQVGVAAISSASTSPTTTSCPT
jgi:hypothetical protein